VVGGGEPRRLIVGISGASGIVYAVRALEVLRSLSVETHLVMSQAADLTRTYETDLSRAELEGLADYVYGVDDVDAAASSGSFVTLGMLIVPCSMRCIGEIASGVTSSLLTRAADVALKERRRLVLVARETPLNLIHLRNMAAVTEAGAIVFPPVPAFYTRPRSLEEMIDHTIGRVLDQFGIHTELLPRWGEGLHRFAGGAEPTAMERRIE
jgi:4-hydroxy-3-polyprenylbenzoate decarboxylase